RDRGVQGRGGPRRHRSSTRQEARGRMHRAVLIQRNISAGGRVDLTMTDTTSVPARLGIDIWLDVACPWCLLGERRLETVIEKLPFGDDIDVRYHSYQLDPTLPEKATQTQAEYLAARGFDPKMMEQSHHHLSAGAAEVGFEFDHDSVVPANTFTAHRLIQAAAAEGVQQKVVDAIFL